MLNLYNDFIEIFKSMTPDEFKKTIYVLVVTSFLGVVFGLLIKATYKTPKLIFSYLKDLRKENYITKEWYMYHYTIKEGKFIPYLQLLKISRSIAFSKYKAVLYEYKVGEEHLSVKKRRILHKGNMEKIDCNYIINLKSYHKVQHDFIHLRFKEIYHDSTLNVIGIYSGIHFDSKIYSTVCLLRENRIENIQNNPTEFDELLNKFSKIFFQQKLLEIK